MKEQRYGKIVNVSPITAKRGDNATVPCYGASKGALIVLTKSLTKELDPFGINVNAVAPHAIDTPMMKAWDEEKKREVTEALPVRRLGTPEDVASAVSYLVSDEASFITGHVINVDGGHFMDS
jgi:3-oxoacyl-[acyl-carrier protein] reductase